MSTSARPRLGFGDRISALGDAFRASSRFFKWRTAVAGGWLLLTILSVAFALSGGEKNPIGATVQVRQILGGHVVHIQNNSGEPWQEMVVTLPGGYRHERRAVRPQESVMIEVGDFVRGGESERESASDHSPSQVTVSTQSGTYVYEASRR